MNTIPLTVYVCNNGFDDNPTWEDMTTEFQNNEPYSFTNTTKTAENWGIKVKLLFAKPDQSKCIELYGIGFAFE